MTRWRFLLGTPGGKPCTRKKAAQSRRLLRPAPDFVIALCSLSSVPVSFSGPLYSGCSGFGLPRTPRLEPDRAPTWHPEHLRGITRQFDGFGYRGIIVL